MKQTKKYCVIPLLAPRISEAPETESRVEATNRILARGGSDRELWAAGQSFSVGQGVPETDTRTGGDGSATM